MTLAAGFFDDAGTARTDRYVCWGGFIGSLDQWNALDGPWRALLAKPYENEFQPKPPLSKFHLSQCQALDGEFATYKRSESDRIQRRFRDIICEVGVVGLAYAVDREAYDRLVQGEAREFLGDAEALCFGQCIKGARQHCIDFFPNHDEVALVFDNVSQMDRKDRLTDMAARYWQFDRKPDDKPVISGLAFESVGKYTPLQAADIIATENAWHAQRFLLQEPARPHFESFLKNVRTVGYLMDDEHIRITLDSYGFKPAS